MLKRIQKIEGVGSYTSAKAGRVEFQEVNVIYGENRNGKSTLCDIFVSLSNNDPTPILTRKAIAKSGKQSEEQFVQLQFENDNKVEFQHGEWRKQLSASKLFIFDHGFAHRNVMTGLEVGRDNSESVSDFILGEEGVSIASELEGKKQAVKSARKNLKDSETRLRGVGVADIDAFVNMELPSLPIQSLNEKLNKQNTAAHSISVQLRQLSKSLARKEPEPLSIDLALVSKFERINRCLSSSIEGAHEQAETLIDIQLSKVKPNDSFKGWVVSGTEYLDSDCPFCGQQLSADATQLITAYKEAFNTQFVSSMASIKSEASGLLALGVSSVDEESLQRQHHGNLELIAAFEEIESALDEHKIRLSTDFDALVRNVKDFNALLTSMYEVAQGRLKAKVDTPYLAQEAVSISKIDQLEAVIGQLLARYSVAVKAVNEIISEHKATLNEADLRAGQDEIAEQIRLLKLQIARLTYDSMCKEYREQKLLVPAAITDFENSKEALENAQKHFLDAYFSEINRLFKQLGSDGFEISRKLNNQGIRPVYDLLVSFNRRKVSRKDFNSVFSESDRRALALCIFIAKINKLSEEERDKAVVVLDDPCTSFDSERMRLIIKSFSQLSRTVKQIIITTHYKQLAAQLMSQFDNCVGLKVVKGINGSEFDRATEAELTASAHDEHYSSIMDMIEGKTQENRARHLRPFLEHEVRQRFKAQLMDLGVSGKTSFSDCIDLLSHTAVIDQEVYQELSDFRVQLNPDMHELEQWSFADIQSFAADMMDFIYSRLRKS